MDETFSSIDLITECLSDTERTAALVKAIERAVKTGDIVLDCGTGSAVLALAAARAGAKKVISLEFDPYVAMLAKENVRRNGFENIIEVVLTDARAINFPEGTRFDVVIMEMLTTGMVDEYQVWAMNNLYRNSAVDPDTRFIPNRQDTYVALSNEDFEIEGFNMRMVRHLWSWLPNKKIAFFTKKELLNSISFKRENDVNFKATLSFPVIKSGVVNSIYLSSVTTLDEKSELGDTLALNAPIAFPLENDIAVKKGDTVKLEISYVFGNGYRNLKVVIL